jgi:hypothetical protein
MQSSFSMFPSCADGNPLRQCLGPQACHSSKRQPVRQSVESRRYVPLKCLARHDVPIERHGEAVQDQFHTACTVYTHRVQHEPDVVPVCQRHRLHESQWRSGTAFELRAVEACRAFHIPNGNIRAPCADVLQSPNSGCFAALQLTEAVLSVITPRQQRPVTVASNRLAGIVPCAGCEKDSVDSTL